MTPGELPPRTKPLKRSGITRKSSRRTGYVARSRSRRDRGANREPSPQKARRSAVDEEWTAYSADVRRRRPRCEAGPLWTTALPGLDGLSLHGLALLDEATVARLRRAADECHGTVSSVHHKTPRGRGPLVPSQGLRETDVVSICTPCHDAAENNLAAVARLLDLVR